MGKAQRWYSIVGLLEFGVTRISHCSRAILHWWLLSRDGCIPGCRFLPISDRLGNIFPPLYSGKTPCQVAEFCNLFQPFANLCFRGLPKRACTGRGTKSLAGSLALLRSGPMDGHNSCTLVQPLPSSHAASHLGEYYLAILQGRGQQGSR